MYISKNPYSCVTFVLLGCLLWFAVLNHQKSKELVFHRSALWQVLENDTLVFEDENTLMQLDQYIFSNYGNPLLIEAMLATINQNISNFDGEMYNDYDVAIQRIETDKVAVPYLRSSIQALKRQFGDYSKKLDDN